jgi:predicted XRE-type DNA-binding protein
VVPTPVVDGTDGGLQLRAEVHSRDVQLEMPVHWPRFRKNSPMNDDTTIQRGSTHHFADIGIADAEANRIRAELFARMNVLIGNVGWHKAEAARRLGLSSHDLSRLLRGQFRDIGVEARVGVARVDRVGGGRRAGSGASHQQRGCGQAGLHTILQSHRWRCWHDGRGNAGSTRGGPRRRMSPRAPKRAGPRPAASRGWAPHHQH